MVEDLTKAGAEGLSEKVPLIICADINLLVKSNRTTTLSILFNV